MPRRRRSVSLAPFVHLVVTLATVLGLARIAAAAQPGAVLDYEVRYGPLQILALRTTARFDGDRYQATTDVRTVGVVAMLFPWSAASDSRGLRDDGTMRPLRFRTAGEYRGTRRLAEIDYESADGPRVRIDPPAETDDRDPVPAGAPAGNHRPADRGPGRRVLRLPRHPARLRRPAPLRPAAQRSRRHRHAPVAPHALCRPRPALPRLIQPLAGFWRSEPRHDERPTQVDYWIAAPRPDLLAVPVYLELSAPRGTLAVHLSGVEPLPAIQTP